VNGLESLWLAYLSQPAGDRVLYRAIRKHRVRRILEIGLSGGRRSLRMIRLAKRYAADAKIRYVGVDLFEDKQETAFPTTSLKSVYRTLRRTGALVHLLPGDPAEALTRSANALPGNELVLISADLNPDSLARAWFYLPRMLSRGAMIFQAEMLGEKSGWRSVPRIEIERLAARGTRRRAA
jgi:predicted O-methyltransferase YrrM